MDVNDRTDKRQQTNVKPEELGGSGMPACQTDCAVAACLQNPTRPDTTGTGSKSQESFQLAQPAAERTYELLRGVERRTIGYVEEIKALRTYGVWREACGMDGT